MTDVAFKMQEDVESQGKMIEKSKLQNVLRDGLHEMGQPDPHTKAENVLSVLKERVGVLSEVSSSPDLFTFLHPSFQEFLVGYGMVKSSNSKEAVANIVKYLDDPNWCEPILTGVSRFCWGWGLPVARLGLLGLFPRGFFIEFWMVCWTRLSR